MLSFLQVFGKSFRIIHFSFSDSMQNTTLPTAANHYLADHITLIHQSFERLLGYPLVAAYIDEEDLAEQLFHASFVLLSHDATADEPLFNYGNAKALELFELNWEELLCLPSRLSAEPSKQEERDKTLSLVAKNGFIQNYQGVRISKTGKRFQIRNAIIWNLTTEDGLYQGQACCFADWNFL